MTMPELRVLIISPNPLARGGLVAMLDGMPGIKTVGGGGVTEAASLAAQLLPDAVLLDTGDGEPEDLDAIARLASAPPLHSSAIMTLMMKVPSSSPKHREPALLRRRDP